MAMKYLHQTENATLRMVRCVIKEKEDAARLVQYHSTWSTHPISGQVGDHNEIIMTGF